jgi:hypothetical protein
MAHEPRLVSTSDSALIESLPALFNGLETCVGWEHTALTRWLVCTRSFWRLAGQGRAFEEVRRLIPRTGGSYELCLRPADRVDLLVLDGTFSPEEEDPVHWAARLAAGAVVVVAGIHPAAGASELFRRWCEASPAPAIFRVATGHGLGLLLPTPESAPPAVRELCASDPATAALFDTAARIAWQMATVVRDAQAARARMPRLGVVDGLRASEIELARAQVRAEELAQQIASLEASTTYRAAMVLQRVGRRFPRHVRILLRRAARLAWWTLRGRLFVALRARRNALREHAASPPQGAVPETGVEPTGPGQPAPPTVARMAAAAPVGFREVSCTAFGTKPLMRVAIGYTVSDSDLPRLARAIERAHRALTAIGQRKVGCILVADDGAPVSLEGWLPPDVLALPPRGPFGFLAAHGRMMEVAFAQGADAYVLTEVRSRFNEDTLAAALTVLQEPGSPGLVCVGNANTGPVIDPAGPTFLLITRDSAARVGPFDDRLDALCGLIDFCLRADTLGIPMLRLKDFSPSLDTSRTEACAVRGLGRHALDAAWVLAGKWGCELFAAQLRAIYATRDIAPPPFVDAVHSERDAMLVAWWKLRMTGGADVHTGQSEPMVDQKAVLPPAELDASMAVPFAALPRANASQRVAAIIHLYYDELSQTTFDTLKHIPVSCDLFITTDTDAKREAISAVFDGWTGGTVDVRVLPNRGGDVGPMLEVLREIIDRYDILLHLHGKVSVHWDRGAEWRTYLYGTLCGSPDIVNSALAAFAATPRLGIVFPQHWGPVRPAISWGYNFEEAQDLAMRIGIDLRSHQPLEFPTGFMFWARTAALAPLLAFDLRPADFIEGFRGSTFAHAVERLLLFICESSGHTWIKIARTDFDDVEPPPLTVTLPTQLREQLAGVSYMLSDPVLCEPGSAQSPWRFRPDDRMLPRLTLIAGADCARERWTQCEAMARAICPELECRVRTVPPAESRTGVPSPVDVCAHDLFVATDEACAQIALQFVQLQQCFFGRSQRVQMLAQLSQDQLRSMLQHAGFVARDDDVATFPQERRA